MTSSLITSTTEASHPRRPETEPISAPTIHRPAVSRRRLTIIDRIALTVGVALVTWSRRPRMADRRDELALRIQRRMSEEQRLREQQRLMLTFLPPR